LSSLLGDHLISSETLEFKASVINFSSQVVKLLFIRKLCSFRSLILQLSLVPSSRCFKSCFLLCSGCLLFLQDLKSLFLVRVVLIVSIPSIFLFSVKFVECLAHFLLESSLYSLFMLLFSLKLSGNLSQLILFSRDLLLSVFGLLILSCQIFIEVHPSLLSSQILSLSKFSLGIKSDLTLLLGSQETWRQRSSLNYFPLLLR